MSQGRKRADAFVLFSSVITNGFSSVGLRHLFGPKKGSSQWWANQYRKPGYNAVHIEPDGTTVDIYTDNNGIIHYLFTPLGGRRDVSIIEPSSNILQDPSIPRHGLSPQVISEYLTTGWQPSPHDIINSKSRINKDNTTETEVYFRDQSYYIIKTDSSGKVTSQEYIMPPRKPRTGGGTATTTPGGAPIGTHPGGTAPSHPGHGGTAPSPPGQGGPAKPPGSRPDTDPDPRPHLPDRSNANSPHTPTPNPNPTFSQVASNLNTPAAKKAFIKGLKYFGVPTAAAAGFLGLEEALSDDDEEDSFNYDENFACRLTESRPGDLNPETSVTDDVQDVTSSILDQIPRSNRTSNTPIPIAAAALRAPSVAKAQDSSPPPTMSRQELTDSINWSAPGVYEAVEPASTGTVLPTYNPPWFNTAAGVCRPWTTEEKKLINEARKKRDKLYDKYRKKYNICPRKRTCNFKRQRCY